MKEVPANHTNNANRVLFIRVIRVIRGLNPLSLNYFTLSAAGEIASNHP
jgi:hypothetical protein